MEGNRTVTWRTSSYSGNNGGQCVEAGHDGRVIAVRDSRDPDGARLAFTAAAWRTFAATLKGGPNS